MRKKIELILVMLTLAGLVMVSKKLEKYVNSDKVEKKEYTVVLDAGHGSSDSGKVGINGVLQNKKVSRGKGNPCGYDTR